MHTPNGPPPAADGAELYPKPLRVYLTREERRLWFWMAAKHGVSPFDLPKLGVGILLRAWAADMAKAGRKIPPDLAQLLGKAENGKLKAETQRAAHPPPVLTGEKLAYEKTG